MAFEKLNPAQVSSHTLQLSLKRLALTASHKMEIPPNQRIIYVLLINVA